MRASWRRSGSTWTVVITMAARAGPHAPCACIVWRHQESGFACVGERRGRAEQHPVHILHRAQLVHLSKRCLRMLHRQGCERL